MSLDEAKTKIVEQFEKSYSVYENALYNSKNGFVSNQSSYNIGYGDAFMLVIEIINSFDKKVELKNDLSIIK